MRHLRFLLTLAALVAVPAWTPALAEAPAATAEAPSAASRVERCPAPTGSRIVPRRDAQGECPGLPAAGQSHDREAVLQTGRSDLSEALSVLNPGISRGR